ncbi:MAG: PQQ-binding-like beta-propeller repeat protein [Planctomycetales bacterium]|nr:PQQ-binding-like beta-propeller repeat protein [Planctomycetales bacterium]
MKEKDSTHTHLARRILVPLLLVSLPIGAMIAFVLYYKHTYPAVSGRHQAAKQPVSFGQDTWPIFRGNEGLTGQAEGTLPDKFKPAWTFKTGGAIKSTPVIADNKAFVSSMDGRLYALHLKTGQEVWRFETDDTLEASPLYHQGRLYIGSNRGTFYAVDAANGTPLWLYKAGGKITGSANISVHPASQRTVVVFGSYDNHLYCLDAESGLLVFKHPAENYINGSIAITGHTAVFGSCDAYLHLVPIEAPDKNKTIDAESYVAANPAVWEDRIFAGNYNGCFLAADIKTGTVLWRFDKTQEAFFSSPAVNDRVVIIGCRDRKVYCFDRQSGEALWTYTAGDNFDSSPVLCGDKAVIGCDDGRLYMLGISTGQEVFVYTLGSPIASSPAIAQNRLLIGCDNGTVYAFIED